MTSLVARFAIAFSVSMEASIVLKATLVLGLTLAAVRLAPRARASIRHIVMAAAFCVLLTLPIVAVLLPPVVLHIPVSTIRDSRIPLVIPELSPAAEYLANTNGQSPATVSSGMSVSASAAIRAGWTVGAVLFLIPLVVSLGRIRRIRRSGLVWSSGELLVRTLAAEAGIRRRVEILSHEEIVAPIICGFLRPAIVMPSDANEWSDADLRQAIVHELEHMRRADWPVHLLARFVSALYWFHPLVWIAWRRLCLESERACDDAVLRGAEQTAYAEQLVGLARRMLNRTTQHALSMASRSDLSARISAVLDANQVRGRVGVFRTAIIGAGVIVLTLAISPLKAIRAFSDRHERLVTNPSLSVGTDVSAPQPDRQEPTVPSPIVKNASSRSTPVPLPSTLNVPTQAASAPPSAFEIVSVKPNPSGFRGFHKGPMLSGDELTAVNVQLRWLIEEAYRVDPYHLSGEPSWVGGAPSNGVEYFDVTAKAPGPASADQMRLMLRQLLVDRFHLIAHTEIRDTPIYALVVMDANGTLGPDLHRAEADCATLRAAAGGDLSRKTSTCGIIMQIGRHAARGFSISQLAGLLSLDAGRPVVDMTGLDGVFDFDLTYTPDPLRHHPPDRFPSVDPDGPSVFTAVQEQLGLKFQAQESLGEVLVIDHVEHPTPD